MHSDERRRMEKPVLRQLEDQLVEVFGRHAKRVHHVGLEGAGDFGDGGLGVAGLILATRLGHVLGRRGLARVRLIDRSWIHVWKPMLHTFAAGTWNLYEQQVQYLAHART